MTERLVKEAAARIAGLAGSMLDDGTATLAKGEWTMDPLAEAAEYVKLAYNEVRRAQDTLLTVEVALEKALTKFGITVEGQE